MAHVVSLQNLDVVAVMGLAICVAVLPLIDWQRECPIFALTCCQIGLCALGQYRFPWWGTGKDYSFWDALLAWRNIGIAFWAVQLCLAVVQPEIIAPRAVERLRNNAIIQWGFVVAGFIAGAERGSLPIKGVCAATLVAMITVRLVVLANHLESIGESARAAELMSAGVQSLLAGPCLGAMVGLACRTKLDASASASASASEELEWLRNHAERLEAARQQELEERARATLAFASAGGAPLSAANDGVKLRQVTSSYVKLRQVTAGGAPLSAANDGVKFEDRLSLPAESSYGSTSELQELHAELHDVAAAPSHKPLELDESKRLVPPIPVRTLNIRKARQDALWRTLAESGLRVTPGTTDGSQSGAGSSSTSFPP